MDIAPFGKIHRLPDDLANQIAAGEVVERPASAVRELVENALDAGATRIEVELEEGGSDLIRVVDDGSGMEPKDAELCVQRHATSKIRKREDLFRIASFGFRGEALPSIASVSRFELVTKERDTLGGTRLLIEGGKLKLAEPWGAAPGTTVTVRDLFYNTPARRKFLKTRGTEMRNCLEAVQRLALVRPDVSFTMTHNGRRVLDLPATDDLWSRIKAIVGHEDAALLYPAPPQEQDGVQAWGFIGAPALTKRTADGLWLYVNERYVRDKTLIGAVRTAYSNLIDRGRHPVVFLFVTVPEGTLDVNVHPAKTEVRFGDPSAVFRAARRSVHNALAQCPWLPEDARPDPGESSATSSGATATSPINPHADAMDVWSGPQRTYRLGGSGRAFPQETRAAQESQRGVEGLSDANNPASISAESLGLTQRTLHEKRWFQSLHFVGIVHNLYLVCSDDAGMVVIDQHAAHERITFEALRSAWRTREVPQQPLLMPEVFELSASRAATLEDNLDFFDAIGFELSSFGDRDFALKAVPAWAAKLPAKKMVVDAIDELAINDKTVRFDEALESILSRMACHGSIRAGDRITPDEVRALLEQLDAVDFGANCPHGRPVYFRMSLAELETRFERR